MNNYCHVEGLTLDQSLEKLTQNTLAVSERLMSVFADKDPRFVETLTRYMHGYVTWHLCDARYRMNEVYEQVGDDEVGLKFRRYYEDACKVGRVDPDKWAKPMSSFMVEKPSKQFLTPDWKVFTFWPLKTAISLLMKAKLRIFH